MRKATGMKADDDDDDDDVVEDSDFDVVVVGETNFDSDFGGCYCYYYFESAVADKIECY